MRTRHTTLISALAATSCVVAQQHVVVPTSNALNDGNRFCAIAGAVDPFRHQILVGAGHLTAVAGKTIQALEFRRSAANETYSGGAVNLTVELSISPNTPLDCSELFAANSGAQTTQVFAGTVAVPTSPPTTSTSIAWTSSNTVRVAFSTPFVYPGGTLCIDIVGQPIPGQNLDWWMADANHEAIASSVTQLGVGCGSYGDGNGTWSWVEKNSLVAGGFARMNAVGTPYGLAVAAIGDGTTNGVPLHLLGIGSPSSCNVHLSTLILLEPRVFMPEPSPFPSTAGGTANFDLKIPGIPAALGARFTTQWLDFSGEWMSNAIEWTVAPSLPALNMAFVEGHPLESTGTATPLMAHVLRFEYQ